MSVVVFSILLLSHFAVKTVVVSATSPFLTNTPGWEWKRVGYLDMTDPTQQCPDSWLKITSPRSSCGKKSIAPCDSFNISTSGASYQKVCGRFQGYEIGTPDAFGNQLPTSLETYFVDGVTVTYGPPGNRSHVYSFAAGVLETSTANSCPCTGGVNAPPTFVGSDYYCESGNPGPNFDGTTLYSSDVLWDGQQCGGNEGSCCNPPELPWFCKTFPNPVTEDLEIRICTDQNIYDESVAIESFELHIQVAIPLINIQATSVFKPDNTIYQLEISWTPMGENLNMYTVRVIDTYSSIGQGCIVCTISPCLYVHQVTQMAANFSIVVRSINEDGTLGTQNSTTISPTNSIFYNVSSLSDSNYVGCSFLNNQSFYCIVCCSSDPSVSSDSSVFNSSISRGTEVIVSLQGLTSGQMYYCKAAATNIVSTSCASPVVGDVKMFFTFVASLPPTSTTTASCTLLASIDKSSLIATIISTSLFGIISLVVLVVTCIVCTVKTKSKVLHQPALQSVYEMVETDQKKITAIMVEANSAYGTAK